MEIYTDNDECIDAGGRLSMFDRSRGEFRLTIWEENGVLHLYFLEPVVIATKEQDLEAKLRETT